MAKEKAPKPPKEKKTPNFKMPKPDGFKAAFLTAPPAIFFEYLIFCAALLLGFRFLFPASRAPLALYSLEWRLIQWVLEFIGLFPALAMSALVIPTARKEEESEGQSRFNAAFLLKLRLPILTAIIATILYGVLFFLAQPLAGNARETMSFRGELYADSRDKAVAHAKMEEWTEATRFATICEQIWPNNPDVSGLKKDIDAEFYRIQYLQDRVSFDSRPEGSDPRERIPVDAAEALRFGEKAFEEERYYDAHWLASLAGRLAGPGSAEVAESVRLAGRAWNAIESLAPNSREKELHQIYQLKRSGYEAMVGQDWIRAYYIFKELIGITPDDPDARKFPPAK